MKRLIFLFLVILVLPIALAEPSVSKEMPSEVEKGKYFEIVLDINLDSAKKFDLVEFLPLGLEIVEWQIEPDIAVDFESVEQEFLGEERNANHWAFESVSDNFQIKYKIYAKDVGTLEFITLWIHPEGFDSFSDNLKIIKATESTSNSSPLTGFVVNPPTQVVIKEQIPFLNLINVKNSFSIVKDIIFGLSY